jgi:protein-S-isoprenylcysteine O-methyltransferase Ste14
LIYVKDEIMKFTVYRLAGGAMLIVLALAVMNTPDVTRRTIGIAVGAVSLVLLILSRTHLGASFSMKPEARELVTKGLYSRIQHPLYFFLDMILWGVIVYFDLPWLFAVWAVLLVVHVMEARREERILQKAFGDAYLRYQSHTWF